MRVYIEHHDENHESPLDIDCDWISYARDATPYDGHVVVHMGSYNVPNIDLWGISYIQTFTEEES